MKYFFDRFAHFLERRDEPARVFEIASPAVRPQGRERYAKSVKAERVQDGVTMRLFTTKE